MAIDESKVVRVSDFIKTPVGSKHGVLEMNKKKPKAKGQKESDKKPEAKS